MWNTIIRAVGLVHISSYLMWSTDKKSKKLLTLNKAQKKLWAKYGHIAVKLLV